MKIKICGIVTEEDAAVINETMPDYAGFVFASSKRKISPFRAMRLRKEISPEIPCVGVFTDTSPEDIRALFENGVIQLAQLHGGQDEEFIGKLTGIPIIQAIRHGKGDAPSALVDYYLYDGANPGSGEAFNWGILPVSSKPWFLAGGINVGNIEKAVELKPYGVDIASGSETDGKKDTLKIRKLVETVRLQNG
ncbi:MAG: phosphoribosylanthranilate isomerase [Ruminococcus sp.]|jgi:phosphoribosylanthranilate isomerase|nr:phosphoribosylanthranilate isomerase [Ruminococcus sp.]